MHRRAVAGCPQMIMGRGLGNHTCDNPHGVSGCVRSVSCPRCTCHLRLHKAAQRHVGSPRGVQPMAETKRFISPNPMSATEFLTLEPQIPSTCLRHPPPVYRSSGAVHSRHRPQNVSGDQTLFASRGERKLGGAHIPYRVLHHARLTAPPPQRRCPLRNGGILQTQV